MGQCQSCRRLADDSSIAAVASKPKNEVRRFDATLPDIVEDEEAAVPSWMMNDGAFPTLAPLHTCPTISEESNEAPSDEEDDFQHDAIRRHVIVKRRTSKKPPVTAQSIHFTEPPSPQHDDAVHPSLLGHLQKLQLAVQVDQAAQGKQALQSKDRDDLQHAMRHGKVLHQYQSIQADLEHREPQQEAAAVKEVAPEQSSRTKRSKSKRRRRKHKRKGSFDLQDSQSWYFDFQAQDFESDVDDDASVGSQASLSLLSESSMEAQRRIFQQAKRKRKERATEDGDDSITSRGSMQSQDYGPVRSGGSVHSQDYGPIRSGGSVHSQDYGPIRSGGSVHSQDYRPTQPNVSLRSTRSLSNLEIMDEDAQSVVSDLDHQSLTSSGYRQRTNDYGVLRRYRRITCSELTRDPRDQLDPKFVQTLQDVQAGKRPLGARLDRLEAKLQQQQRSQEASPTTSNPPSIELNNSFGDVDQVDGMVKDVSHVLESTPSSRSSDEENMPEDERKHTPIRKSSSPGEEVTPQAASNRMQTFAPVVVSPNSPNASLARGTYQNSPVLRFMRDQPPTQMIEIDTETDDSTLHLEDDEEESEEEARSFLPNANLSSNQALRIVRPGEESMTPATTTHRGSLAATNDGSVAKMVQRFQAETPPVSESTPPALHIITPQRELSPARRGATEPSSLQPLLKAMNFDDSATEPSTSHDSTDVMEEPPSLLQAVSMSDDQSLSSQEPGPIPSPRRRHEDDESLRLASRVEAQVRDALARYRDTTQSLQ